MYQNGKIYKIVSDLTDMIYIGSTVQPLCKRHHTHISHFNNGSNKCTSVELIKLGKTRIELIEDYPCERKEQLNAREGYYIKLYKDTCVNRCIMGRTEKEWRNDNKEYLSEKHKEYRDNNKEIIKERIRKWRNENKDKINEYNNRPENREKMLQTLKNRENIKSVCECGGTISSLQKKAHLKTKMHQEFISKQN